MEWFDRLSDDQLISTAKQHKERFDAAWQKCMANHYTSGVYIDASVQLDLHYKALRRIDSYIYGNRPAGLYSRLHSEVGI